MNLFSRILVSRSVEVEIGAVELFLCLFKLKEIGPIGVGLALCSWTYNALRAMRTPCPGSDLVQARGLHCWGSYEPKALSENDFAACSAQSRERALSGNQ